MAVTNVQIRRPRKTRLPKEEAGQGSQSLHFLSLKEAEKVLRNASLPAEKGKQRDWGRVGRDQG